MKILVVIPARGGSKGIPLKNIYPVHGKPLLEYTIECIQASGVECTVAISTDSGEIAKVAEKYANVVVIHRPSDISGDMASTESALLHAIDHMNDVFDETFEYVVTLPATSPLRKASTVADFIDAFDVVKEEYDAQLTLHESYSDYWVYKNGSYERLNRNAPRRRQERQPLYIENSAIYITKITSLRETNVVLGHNPAGYVIDEIEGIDINEIHDISLVESYLKR